MRTGIAVGIAAISVQIVNPVYAEESETQNINYTAEVNLDEFVTESDQSSEENQSVEDVQSIDDSKEDENITTTYTGEDVFYLRARRAHQHFSLFFILYSLQ